MSCNYRLGAEIGSLMNLFRRSVNLPHDPGTDFEISRTNGMIIGYLMDHDGGVMQRDIEEAFSVRRSTVSRVLKLMEQKGLITRAPVSHDARLKRITLTDKGRKAHIKAMQEIEFIEGKMVAGIPDQDLELFKAVLSKMKENLDS